MLTHRPELPLPLMPDFERETNILITCQATNRCQVVTIVDVREFQVNLHAGKAVSKTSGKILQRQLTIGQVDRMPIRWPSHPASVSACFASGHSTSRSRRIDPSSSVKTTVGA